MAKRKSKNAARIQKAVSGITINIFRDLTEVYAEGERLCDAGATDAELAAGIKAFNEKLCAERDGDKTASRYPGGANYGLRPYKVKASCGHVEVRKMRETTAGVAFDPAAEYQLDRPNGMPCPACTNDSIARGENPGSCENIMRLRGEAGQPFVFRPETGP